MSSIAKKSVVRLRDFRPSEVGSKVSSAVSSFADQVTGVAKSTHGFVRSNPWQAVGAGVLAGLAAGVVVSLSTRRLRRRRAAGSGELSAPSEVSGG